METDNALNRAKVFCYYFVRSLEDRLLVYLDILEEESNADIKTSSIPGKGVSGAANAIPMVGKVVSVLIQETDKLILSRIHKKKSKKFAKFAYKYREDNDAFKKEITLIALQIFASFEQQFTEANSEEGPYRAMQKLAMDAVYRLITYILENPDEELSDVFLIKGVLNGNSMGKCLGLIKTGKTVLKDDEKEWKTGKIFTKVGIYLNDRYFKNEKSSPLKYGYRRLFDFEDEEVICDIWYEEENVEMKYNYELNMEKLKELLPECWEFYAKQYPLELAKLEREKYHEKSAEDRENKHEELLNDNKEKFEESTKQREKIHEHTLTAIENTQNTIVQSVESNFEKVAKEHLENTEKSVVLIQTLQEQTNDNMQKVKDELKAQLLEIINTKATSGDSCVTEPLGKLVNDAKNALDRINKDDVSKLEQEVRDIAKKVESWKDSDKLKRAEEEARRIRDNLRDVEKKILLPKQILREETPEAISSSWKIFAETSRITYSILYL